MFAQRIAGGLLTQVLVADHEDRTLLGGAGGRQVLEQIVSIAESRGCNALVGASSSGERLIGALLTSFPGAFHVWDPGRSESVLVVEGVAVGDAAVQRAIELAGSCGASEAFGVLVSPAERPARLSSPLIQAVGLT